MTDSVTTEQETGLNPQSQQRYTASRVSLSTCSLVCGTIVSSPGFCVGVFALVGGCKSMTYINMFYSFLFPALW